MSSPVPPPLPFIPEPLPAPHLQPPDPRRGRWRRHLWPPHLLGGLVHRTLVRPLGLESCSRPGAISWAPGWGWGVRGHLMTDLHCSLNPRTRGVLPTSEGPPRSLRGASPLPQTKSPVSVDSAGAEQCASEPLRISGVSCQPASLLGNQGGRVYGLGPRQREAQHRAPRGPLPREGSRHSLGLGQGASAWPVDWTPMGTVPHGAALPRGRAQQGARPAPRLVALGALCHALCTLCDAHPRRPLSCPLRPL